MQCQYWCQLHYMDLMIHAYLYNTVKLLVKFAFLHVNQLPRLSNYLCTFSAFAPIQLIKVKSFLDNESL